MKGLSSKGIFNVILPWSIKLIVFEPLRLVEVFIFKKKINNYSIKQSPIFILGHYRSGTTFLQCLFACDSRFGYMDVFQHIAPELMLLYKSTLKKILQVISNILKAKNHFHRVRLDWSFPGEEDIGLMNLLCEYSPTWGFLFPQKFIKHFTQCSKLENPVVREKWKHRYMYLVKKISLQNNHKPLVLKSPPNTARIVILKELFPDAKFVYISREPYEVFVSTERLWHVSKKYMLGSIKGVDKNELIFMGFETLMNAYLEQKLFLKPDELIEINYDDLISDTVSTMNKIYVHLKLNEFEYARPDIEKFVNDKKDYIRLTHSLPEKLNAYVKIRWEKYFQAHERIKNKM